jgi:integrase
VRVKTLTVQDESDAQHIRLTAKQANELIHLPDRSTLAGLRDAALIGLALATGLRADELVSLKIDDLYHRLGGKDALLVRESKGFKQRLVPYGAHISVLQLVHKWMNTAGIKSGYIFRGVTKGRRARYWTSRLRFAPSKLYTHTGFGVFPFCVDSPVLNICNNQQWWAI